MSLHPYYGGKSVRNRSSRWVASLLPPVTDGQTYVEPFCGMCGVLLQRPPASYEVACDADERIVNIFRAVRRHPEELSRRMFHTLYHQSEWDDAWEILDSGAGDLVERAWAALVVLGQSAIHCISEPEHRRHQASVAIRRHGNVAAKIVEISPRLQNVEFAAADACATLDRFAADPKAVIYCDPPYPSAEGAYAPEISLDLDAMAEILSSAKARIAVSGYGDEWDRLGWRRSVWHSYSSFAASRSPLKGAAAARDEVVWTNYPPPPSLLLLPFDDPPDDPPDGT